VLAARSNCTVAARDSNSKISFAQAEAACSCILGEAQRRWSFEEFVVNEGTYTTKLKDDGTIGKCTTQTVSPSNTTNVFTKYAGSWRSACTQNSAAGAPITTAFSTLRFDGNNLIEEVSQFDGPDCINISYKLSHSFNINDAGNDSDLQADKVNLTRKDAKLRYTEIVHIIIAKMYSYFGYSDWAQGVEHTVINRPMEVGTQPQFLIDEMMFDIFKISGSRLYRGKVTSTLDRTTSTKRPDTLNYAFAYEYLWDLNAPPVFTSALNQTLTLGQSLNIIARDPDGDSLTMKCESNCPDGLSVSDYYASWTPTQIGDFNQITLTASDGSKSVTKSFSVKVISSPGAPTGVSATPGALSITLTWSAPASDGGSPITDYIIQYSTNSGASWNIFSDGSSSANSAIITNLNGSTSYLFKVAAKNSVGVGQFSNSSSSIYPRIPPSAPTGLSGIAGNANSTLTWAAPASSGGSPITDYVVQYSSDGGALWATFIDGISVNTSVIVSDLSNGSNYVFRIAAVNAAGTSSYSDNSLIVTPAVQPCSSDCYSSAQSLPISEERKGPSGVILSLQYANGSNGFKIWTEKNGNRILNATGNIAFGWQKKLTRAGTSFGSGYLTFPTDIAGRTCPQHTFLNHLNMTATEQCLYYDSGNASQRLDKSHPNVDGPIDSIEASDWLTQWDSAASGAGIASSFFEGNIKTCADKGMRLPTMYETTMTKPTGYLPAGDSVSPTWAGTNGVPSSPIAAWSWTASATTSNVSQYFGWSGTSNGIGGYAGSNTFRCVLPAHEPDNYVGAQSLPVGTERIGPENSIIQLIFANGVDGFKIWREKNGDRILNATGILANGWQKNLTRNGTAFTNSDFTSMSSIAGRVCPPNVFLNYTQMKAEKRCLYFDQGSTILWTLDQAHPDLSGNVGNLESEDWLRNWNQADTGRTDDSSYYEGNIKNCADKGMRLPTIYETSTSGPTSNNNQSVPTGDSIGSPIWAGNTRGVPAFGGSFDWTWTASAFKYSSGTKSYWMWSGTGVIGNGDYNYVFQAQRTYVRCVLP